IDGEFMMGDLLIDLAGEDQSTAFSVGVQEPAQLCAGSMTVGQDEPVAGGLGLRPGFGSPGEDGGLSGENSVGGGKGNGVFEAMVEEQTLPAGGRNQGMGGAQVVVGESPPAVGQAEDEVDEADGSGSLEQQEQGAGGGQVQDMAQGLAQIPGGMQ